jgi:hypothetical protein
MWNNQMRFALRPICTQENKFGIGPDRNKIGPTHGLSVQIFVFQLACVAGGFKGLGVYGEGNYGERNEKDA